MTAVVSVGAARGSSRYVAGDYLELAVTVVDEAGDAVDISGASAIRYGISAIGPGGGPQGPALVTKSLGSGIAITNGAGGIFTVTLASGDTAALLGTYFHEAEIIVDGKVSTVFRGDITVAAQLLTAS